MRFGSHYTSTKYIANPTPIDFIPSRVHGLGEGEEKCAFARTTFVCKSLNKFVLIRSSGLRDI